MRENMIKNLQAPSTVDDGQKYLRVQPVQD